MGPRGRRRAEGDEGQSSIAVANGIDGGGVMGKRNNICDAVTQGGTGTRIPDRGLVGQHLGHEKNGTTKTRLDLGEIQHFE